VSGRFLVVNADDFGASRGVNRGVVGAHERGIVTSASLMVHGAAAEEAAEYARAHPRLGIGLHVDLGEWRLADGAWKAVYERVPGDDGSAVTREVVAQLARFRRLLGRDPTHLDSHQHVHRDEPAASVCHDLATGLGVPLRHFGPARYCGDFYGQDRDGSSLLERISVGHLVATLKALPAGVTELACHPAETSDLDDMYGSAREDELRALCDPLVRETLRREQILVGSFADLRARTANGGW
jgi:predicted glycoside hydrolase/deacetylase ChbG (UPF0249 family)